MASWWRGSWVVLAGVLALLGGCSSSGTGGGGGDFQASALADAGTLGYPDGAHLVRWRRLSDRVVAYLVYRDTNPYAPVAVEDGYATHFIDAASPLPAVGQVMESTEVTITLHPTLGTVQWTRAVTYASSAAEQTQANLQVTPESFRVTARRVPLHPGQPCGYQLRVLFVQYESGGTDGGQPAHPGAYRLVLGQLSGASPRLTLVPPPPLQAPQDGAAAWDGRYRCGQVAGATHYTLQLSPTGTVYPVSVTASPESVATAAADYPLSSLNANAAFRNAGMVYWRMGARAAGQPLPVALIDRAQNGWVFAAPRHFRLPASPPPPP